MKIGSNPRSPLTIATVDFSVKTPIAYGLKTALKPYGYIRKPVINPKASPNMIGNGNPGKMPFFSKAKKVMMEPVRMPNIAIMVGRMLGRKLKNITPMSIE